MTRIFFFRKVICLGIIFLIGGWLLMGKMGVVSPNFPLFQSENRTAFPNREELMQMSKRLRDMARFLSPKWPLIINLKENQPWLVTDFKISNDDWIPLTIGYGLNLVSQELSVLEQSLPDPSIDLLLRLENSQQEQQFLEISLAQFCAYLQQFLEENKTPPLVNL